MGEISSAVTDVAAEELPPGDVTIRVAYSSLNYKDGLASTGHPGVARRFPHIPGIDAAGTVLASQDTRYRAGDEVLVTGFDLGAGQWGGYAEQIRVPAAWVVPLPTGLTQRESMIFGTAGFTAAIGVEALLAHDITPERGEIVVTGATGGVGSLAVAMLGRLGYRVVAVSGKPEAADFLKELGATEVVPRDAVDDRTDKALLGARWAGAIDTVGGNTLATILRSTTRHGCVTACGLVGGVELPLTVHPFILRGVQLVGLDSATYPSEKRPALWAKMAGPWRPKNLDMLVADEVPLERIPAKVSEILAGRIRGRVLVRL
ncbi:MAG: acryloyl-CoA reductase [Pirellulales bacterium]|nr:acryloyl-CoA reductase [Pirellulales bacterium]